MEPKKIHLSDYKPNPFLIDTVDLVVDIFDDKTIVSSKMLVRKNENSQISTEKLELNGENLELKEIKINSRVLEANEFQVSDDKLILFKVSQSEFILETIAEINPYKNFALEGFYQSGPQLCTQCEPEGFRKITYFIDRPDNMSIFSTKMIADKKRYPYLLSNGNKTSSGELENGRHWVKWNDPFRKPSYLFAMVAGQFDVARDTFKTKSGRVVDLEIYVDPGNLNKTQHALYSLKQSMKWDEEVFGLEYDLDIYMIVAVDSFNMGAMENKGLNIFNSTYTLADEKSATDHDFQNIQGVIGHEYFHNWTGNRVTCRDWFQLTLKEGLTVYRDQEFSSDMLSRPVKRLEDIKMLKEFQFPEDAGPLAHPIRPSSFVEINNFYTRTVYEKGAEVIRMLSVLIGEDNFKKGMKKYFELFDGKAVTTEDFVFAMEEASGIDLSQFKNWYSRAGTPRLKLNSTWEDGKFVLNYEQSYPHTSWKVDSSNVLHFPFKIGLLIGSEMQEHLLEIKELKGKFEFLTSTKPIVSLNRGFTAPLHVEYEYSESEMLALMACDNDFYSRYEATQKVFESLLRRELNARVSQDLPESFTQGFQKLLHDQSLEDAFLSYLIDLPSEGSFSQDLPNPDYQSIKIARDNLEKKIGIHFYTWFEAKYNELTKVREFDLTPASYGLRSLKNRVLSYIVASGKGESHLRDHYFKATNMTEEIHGLELYLKMGVSLDHDAIQSFYKKWGHDAITMIKWFGAISAHTPQSDVLSRLKTLENDKLFLNRVPNYLRALYANFARLNLSAFHLPDGSGYQFFAERIVLVDKFNPQIAARMATNFSQLNKLSVSQREKMKASLELILKSNPSRDTLEVINKYLAH